MVRHSGCYPGPGLDVCPPVQEDLDGPEAAFLSSPVEGSISILTDTQRDNTLHKYMEYKYYSRHTYIFTSINSYIHVHILNTIPRIKNIKFMHACLYVYMIVCFRSPYLVLGLDIGSFLGE